MDNIKNITGISCTGNMKGADKGQYVKINGRVGVVTKRSAERGRGGYTAWTVVFGVGDDLFFSTDTMNGLVITKPTSLEALALRTKMLCAGMAQAA
jgi:hypothetical protein